MRELRDSRGYAVHTRAKDPPPWTKLELVRDVTYRMCDHDFDLDLVESTSAGRPTRSRCIVRTELTSEWR
jgi:hypothetical protein